MTPAFSYLRVSGKAQVAGDGFPRQRDVVATYAASHAVQIAAEFTEKGVTGTKELDDRPQLAALLDRIDAEGVKLVLVERADRLARDLMVGEIILAEFRKRGVTVIAADSGTDLTVADEDPTRKLIRQVLGAVAEFEKSVLVMKLKAARQRKRAETGRCEGRKPFGDRPGEAEILDRILKMRRAPRGGERLSFAQIAAALNADNVPTRQGGPWAPRTIKKLIDTHRPHLRARKPE